MNFRNQITIRPCAEVIRLQPRVLRGAIFIIFLSIIFEKIFLDLYLHHMYNINMTFEWDDAKNERNKKIHDGIGSARKATKEETDEYYDNYDLR